MQPFSVNPILPSVLPLIPVPTERGGLAGQKSPLDAKEKSKKIDGLANSTWTSSSAAAAAYSSGPTEPADSGSGTAAKTASVKRVKRGLGRLPVPAKKKLIESAQKALTSPASSPASPKISTTRVTKRMKTGDEKTSTQVAAEASNVMQTQLQIDVINDAKFDSLLARNTVSSNPHLVKLIRSFRLEGMSFEQVDAVVQQGLSNYNQSVEQRLQQEALQQFQAWQQLHDQQQALIRFQAFQRQFQLQQQLKVQEQAQQNLANNVQRLIQLVSILRPSQLQPPPAPPPPPPPLQGQQVLALVPPVQLSTVLRPIPRYPAASQNAASKTQ